jgi:hypothetical protein
MLVLRGYLDYSIVLITLDFVVIAIVAVLIGEEQIAGLAAPVLMVF